MVRGRRRGIGKPLLISIVFFILVILIASSVLSYFILIKDDHDDPQQDERRPLIGSIHLDSSTNRAYIELRYSDFPKEFELTAEDENGIVRTLEPILNEGYGNFYRHAEYDLETSRGSEYTIKLRDLTRDRIVWEQVVTAEDYVLDLSVKDAGTNTRIEVLRTGDTLTWENVTMYLDHTFLLAIPLSGNIIAGDSFELKTSTFSRGIRFNYRPFYRILEEFEPVGIGPDLNVTLKEYNELETHSDILILVGDILWEKHGIHFHEETKNAPSYDGENATMGVEYLDPFEVDEILYRKPINTTFSQHEIARNGKIAFYLRTIEPCSDTIKQAIQTLTDPTVKERIGSETSSLVRAVPLEFISLKRSETSYTIRVNWTSSEVLYWEDMIVDGIGNLTPIVKPSWKVDVGDEFEFPGTRGWVHIGDLKRMEFIQTLPINIGPEIQLSMLTDLFQRYEGFLNIASDLYLNETNGECQILNANSSSIINYKNYYLTLTDELFSEDYLRDNPDLDRDGIKDPGKEIVQYPLAIDGSKTIYINVVEPRMRLPDLFLDLVLDPDNNRMICENSGIASPFDQM